jgi:hypothetical protein
MGQDGSVVNTLNGKRNENCVLCIDAQILRKPQGLAVDGKGTLWVVDSEQCTVLVY